MVNFLDRITRQQKAHARTQDETAALEQLATQLTRPTNASFQPSSLATAIALRDVANLRSNSKLFAAYLAELTYNSQIPAASVEPPTRTGTKGRVCKQSDFSSPWFLYWANRLKFAPRLHRKLWEDAYVVQCLWERDCLQPGKTGLGLAVGADSLPSLFVTLGRASWRRIFRPTMYGAKVEFDPSACVEHRLTLEAADRRPDGIPGKLLVRVRRHDQHSVQVRWPV